MADDEEEEEQGFGGLYEGGHWAWDDKEGCLVFVPDLTLAGAEAAMKTGPVILKDLTFKELDLLEQLKYKTRYARKFSLGGTDVITLQDIKDLVIFTAPLPLLSVSIIEVLHQPTTERLIRALILYCQYYLQVTDTITKRIKELDMKLRTPACLDTEREFREDLCDLRVLIAKEYYTFVIAGDDMKKFHHMGKQKKMKSLTDKDGRFFESFLQICLQIVWLALARRSYNRLEVEIHRLFKTDTFNMMEHRLQTGFLSKMLPFERNVFLGTCLRHDPKLKARSPLSNEVFCPRFIDFRMFGLGTIKNTDATLNARMRYMLAAIAAPEGELEKLGVTVGILGRQRSAFDTVFQLIPATGVKSGSMHSKSSVFGTKKDMSKQQSRASGTSTKSTESKKFFFADIVLPPKDDVTFPFPQTFPEESAKHRSCDSAQRKRWLLRLDRLLHPKCRSAMAVRAQESTTATG